MRQVSRQSIPQCLSKFTVYHKTGIFETLHIKSACILKTKHPMQISESARNPETKSKHARWLAIHIDFSMHARPLRQPRYRAIRVPL